MNQQLELINQQGFSRVILNGDAPNYRISFDSKRGNSKKGQELEIVDRMSVGAASEDTSRLADSIETAFFEGAGDCSILFPDKGETV